MVLITGASGMLGRTLMHCFASWDATGLAFSRTGPHLTQLDLRDEAATTALLHQIRPQVIIHTAAERRPDVSEKDPNATLALNVRATAHLAQLAKEMGSWILYISTDYVFDGTHPPYSPRDTPNPLNFYGRTKLEGERALQVAATDWAILRAGVLYGDVETLEESAVTAVVKDVRSEKPVKVDHWARRYPTLVDDLALVIRDMAERRLKGVYHWCGPECFTKYEMALAMGEILGTSTSHLEPDPNPPGGAPRPRDCQLDTSALTTIGICHQTPFRDALKRILL